MRRRRGDEAGGQETAELAALADGLLGPERRAALEEQVAASPELAERLAEQQRAVALMQGAAAEVAAPAALRERIDAQSRARGSAHAPARRGLVLAGATAAAAVIAVAISLAVLNSGSSSQQFHTTLASTGLAPGAEGDATLTKTDSGWRIKLDASGLPRLENGQFYEAWLRNAGGVLVPVGTFNEGQKVTLWAGVSPVDFPTLTVTRERTDGDQASSGQKVLVGTVDTGSG
jgi:anti-sigma-K factor RskA